MDGRVGRLHCRYNMSGEVAVGVRARLDRLAVQAVTHTDAALQELLGDTPAVYVLRDVTTRHAWNTAQLSDGRLAELWGRGIASALMRAIATDSGDGFHLVRFDDHADYVASFVIDLIEGAARSRWWYGEFASYAAWPRRRALLAVLLEHRDRLADILALLHRRGALTRVLDALGEPARQVLLGESARRVLLGEPDAPPTADREAIRPLLATAIELSRALGLWTGRLDQASVLERYVATGPHDRVWSDARDLADGVWEAFAWLDALGAIDRRATMPAGLVNAALAPLDWLDIGHLRERLLGRLARHGAGGDMPVRPPLAPTPRQVEVVQALLSIARSGVAGLDPADPASAANALRLYAALADSAPHFRGDPSIPALVQLMLGGWSWVAAQASPTAALDRLRREDIPLPLAGSDDATALRIVVRIGTPATDLIEALEIATGTRHSRSRPVDSACAGTVLLLRTVTDLRLSAIADLAGFPPETDTSPGALLLALGRRWAGPDGACRGRVDAGLAALAGLDAPPTLEEVGRAWSRVTAADEERFERAWFATLAAQGVLGDGDLNLHLLPAGRGRMAVIAGTPTGLWPLGRIIREPGELPAILAGWLRAWEAETGLRPSVRCGTPLAGTLRARLPCELLAPDDTVAATAHQSGRSAFLRAHRAMRWGRTGRTGSDLLVELVAGSVVRLWARWLRGFSAASVPYLLDEFVRRPGSVRQEGSGVHVELDPRPLDVVLEIAGYTDDISAVPGLGGRDVTIRIRRS